MTYPVGDCAAHGGDHGDAAAVAPADHLLRYCLGCHEYTSDIDFEHHVGVCLSVVEGGSLLLDTSGGNETVESALGLADAFDNGIEALHVTDVDLAVVESVAELLSSPLLHSVEVRARLGQAVKCVHSGTSFEQSFSLNKAETSSSTSYKHDFVVQVELRQTLGGAKV